MIVSIEGSIGAGKTTLLKILENEKFTKDHIVFYEPVDEWMSYVPTGSSTSLFEMFYNDKKKYSFIFQMYALQSRFSNMLKIAEQNPDKLIICERSHLTDYQIFAKMLHDDGLINDLEYDIYKRWFTLVCDNISQNISATVYLRVTPDVCVTRIAKRNRKGEDNIDIKYINHLHTLHDEWLLNATNNFVVDGNNTTVDVRSIVDYINSIVHNSHSNL